MTACTYLGCTVPAVSRIDPPNSGRSWFGCQPHTPSMVKALSIGCASDLGADVRPLPKVATR